MTGADMVVQVLADEGVDTIFGYSGGAILPTYDAVFRYNDKHRNDNGDAAIPLIVPANEQGAGFMASGYARASGKVGVVMVTSGPGATNTVTPVRDCMADSVPIVVICGQVPTAAIGTDAFQEAPVSAIMGAVAKHIFLVTEADKLEETIRSAFELARTGRPGPVVIDIPKDITAAKCEFHYPSEIKMRSYNPTVKGHIGQIKRAADLILSAERPMIYTGGGVILSNASEQLTTFTRMLGYPITNTLMGLGAYPASDKQFVGMLGMHGTYEANMGMHHCDVLVAIGARFDDRVTGNLEKFCPDAKIIHIDVDPASISKNVKVDIPIVGQVSQVLDEFIKVLTSSRKEPNASALEKWWAQIEEWRSQDCLKYDRDSELIKPQFVIEQLHELTKGDAFVTSDVGQHQMWAAQYYGFNKPRRWINSGGLGTMGFGLPAAMGVQLAYPDETVVCVTGEASIQMCIQELSTCKQYGLPIKVICLNNGYMGMVRQWQEFFYEKRYAMSYFDALPDFVGLTQSYGHTGIQIDKPADVRAALEEALGRKDELVFLDCLTDKTENVYPMIPAGAGLNEMILV